MRRIVLGVGAVALMTALSPLPSNAQTAHHDRGPAQIALPNGWQPEGITTDGKRLYAGSLADGAIWVASAKSGKGRLLAAGVDGRVAVGVDYDRKRDLLWVAGGPTGEVRAQDADTGKVVATYDFGTDPARFLNDLVVTRHAVYVTDSMNQELGVIPLHKHRLASPSAARTLPLTGDLVYVEGFNLNGITTARHALVAVQSNTGLLFRINPWTGNTTTVDLGGTTLVNGDGLESRHRKLYVVQNQFNQIAVVKLTRHARAGTQVATLTDPDLDIPATVAYARGALWAANARFTTEPTPETTYSIVRVSLRP